MSRLTLTEALCQAESQARSTLPAELYERLSAAVSLVKEGRVFQDSAGEWQVGSTAQAGLTYSVNGACDCQDYQYNKPPKGLCKHRLAMFLSKRVLSLMAPPAAPVVPGVVEPWPDNDPEPAPEVLAFKSKNQPLYEAPASANVHVTIAGRDVLVTLRDSDEGRLLERLQTILERFPAPEPAPQASSQDGYCHRHNCAMQENMKEGRRWFSHRTADGQWCKGT
jgi:hypothetical protein